MAKLMQKVQIDLVTELKIEQCASKIEWRKIKEKNHEPVQDQKDKNFLRDESRFQ